MTVPNCTQASTTRRGVNLQVACTLAGHLAWISPALPGSVHDAKAIKESGFLAALNAQSHIGDKGYIGLGMITRSESRRVGEECP